MMKNPAFFFFPDNFTKPYPFTPTLAVSIDDVLEKKVQALDALESQVYEGGALGNAGTRMKRFGDDPVRRVNFLLKSWSNRHERIAKKHRESLIEWYGEEAGNAVKHAEAFELCEYGSKPSNDQLRRLFPFFGEAP
jgi:hypothetical protein